MAAATTWINIATKYVTLSEVENNLMAMLITHLTYLS